MNNQILEFLYRNKNMANHDEKLRFIEGVKRLEPGDTTLLPDLFYLFYDNNEDDTGLQYLASYISAFDLSIVIYHLVQVTPKLIRSAREWLIVFYMIGLPQLELIGVWKNAIDALAENDRLAIYTLLEEIEEEIKKRISVTQYGLDVNKHILASIKQLTVKRQRV